MEYLSILLIRIFSKKYPVAMKNILADDQNSRPAEEFMFRFAFCVFHFSFHLAWRHVRFYCFSQIFGQK